MNVFKFECDIAGASAKFVRLLLMTVAFVFDLSMKSYAYDSEDELIVDEYEYFVAEDVGYEEEESEEKVNFPKLSAEQKKALKREALKEFGRYAEGVLARSEQMQDVNYFNENILDVEESAMRETGLYNPEFGNSVYDKDLLYATDLQDLENFRAHRQSGLLQLVNGILKGTGLAGSVFVNGTVGLVEGIGEALVNRKSSRLHTNVASKTVSNFNDAMGEALPNYMTREERENEEKGEWLENISRANFWGCVLGGYQQRGIKSFGEFLFFFFANVVVSVAVGAFGARKEVGFKWAFLLSCAFSPFVGFIITLFSKKKNVIEFNEPSIKEV